MFDKPTTEALSRLNDEDLFKVSKMIQKLDKKSSGQKKKEGSFIESIKKGSGKSMASPLGVDGDRTNLFDSMSEKGEHKEDSIIDAQLSQMPPTERNRRTNTVTVTCMRCERSEEVSEKIVPGERNRYICNNCQTRGAKG